jgi:hypothetical protein
MHRGHGVCGKAHSRETHRHRKQIPTKPVALSCQKSQPHGGTRSRCRARCAHLIANGIPALTPVAAYAYAFTFAFASAFASAHAYAHAQAHARTAEQQAERPGSSELANAQYLNAH